MVPMLLYRPTLMRYHRKERLPCVQKGPQRRLLVHQVNEQHRVRGERPPHPVRARKDAASVAWHELRQWDFRCPRGSAPLSYLKDGVMGALHSPLPARKRSMMKCLSLLVVQGLIPARMQLPLLSREGSAPR